MQIKDKTFFVTGGASGLGFAVVEELLGHGANVVIIDLKEMPSNIKALNGKKVLYVRANIVSEEEIKKAIKAGVKKFGPTIAGLINSGGIGIAGKTVKWDGVPADLEAFKLVIGVNMVGTFNVSRLVASEMVKQAPDEDGERGVIILMSSVASQDGQIGQVAYASSKGGIASMTLPMARDLAPFGIRVLCIAPGPFDTPMTMQLSEKLRKFLVKLVTFPVRLGKPKEFAALTIHLIQNPYMNAEVIRLDGGIRLAKI